jgi:hypothetical protein
MVPLLVSIGSRRERTPFEVAYAIVQDQRSRNFGADDRRSSKTGNRAEKRMLLVAPYV